MNMNELDNTTEFYRDEDTGMPMAKVNLRTHDVTSKAQKETFKEMLKNEEYRQRTRSKNWVACYHESIKAVTHKLKLNEFGALLKLVGYMQFKKEGMLYAENTPLNTADIAKIIGKGNRQTSTIIKSLRKEGIIIKGGSDKKPTFTISKEYHSMGTVTEGMKFTKLYHQMTRKFADNMTNQEYGILYKILPYFHYNNYYLCANPDEQDENMVQFLNQAELAELIGEDIKTVRTYMKKLEHKGFILSQSGHGVMNYIVHPDVMFRRDGENEYTDTVRYQFEQLRLHRKQRTK